VLEIKPRTTKARASSGTAVRKAKCGPNACIRTVLKGGAMNSVKRRMTCTQKKARVL
jgi:hypothetical protein